MENQQMTPVGDTRERILEAAFDRFAARGYAGTSTREVCQRAGVNPAALNYHWGSKERLWHAVNARTNARITAIVQGGLDLTRPPLESFERVLGALFDALAADPRPARILMWTTLQAESLDYEATASVFDSLVKTAMALVGAMKELGVVGDVDHEVVIPLLNAQVIYAFVDRPGHRRFYGRDLSDPEHAARFKRQFLRSVRLLLELPEGPGA